MATPPPMLNQDPQLPLIEELQERREQLDKELQVLGQSFTKLKEAQDRFAQNIATIASLKAAPEEQEILMPLTTSVYVAAQLVSKDTVMVDLGTGYFVEKGVQAADEYYVRKVKFLQEQISMLGRVITEKRQNMAAITQALQLKIQEKVPSI